MTIIEKLDAFYELSLEMELENRDREELISLHTALADKCAAFLKNPTFTNERKNKFAQIVKLAKDECVSISRGYDTLLHYPLLRDYLEDLLAFCKRGCRDYVFA